MTTTTQHTPGPWHVKGQSVYAEHPHIAKRIATCPDSDFLNASEVEANASLIAAAPETARERDALKAERDQWKRAAAEHFETAAVHRGELADVRAKYALQYNETLAAVERAEKAETKCGEETERAERWMQECQKEQILVVDLIEALKQLSSDISDFRLDMENGLGPSSERLNVIAGKADVAIASAEAA